MAFEKVSPQHPDKIADRIAGAIVDHCYTHSEGGWLKSNPRVAVEVLLGHGKCYVMIETSCTRAELSCNDVDDIVHRIVGDVEIFVTICDQDPELSKNQKDGIKVADNGIFKGCPPTEEQRVLTAIAATIYGSIPYDGKYIINTKREVITLEPLRVRNHGMLTVCQSHATKDDIRMALTGMNLFNGIPIEQLEGRDMKEICKGIIPTISADMLSADADGEYLDFSMCEWDYTAGKEECKSYNPYTLELNINPLGPWTGGPDVDCGCTNRKLGSDQGDGVTGGGLCGKDLSKGDVSINIVAFLKAVQSGQTVTACCSIGDENVTFQYADGRTVTETFADVVEMARLFILTDCQGSFERFAMWGLIAPPAL